MKNGKPVHLTPALNKSLGAAPHPACGHLLPKAEKDLSPARRGSEQTARAGSQLGRGTSSVVPTPSPQSGEGQVPAGEQLLDPKEVGQRLKLSPRTVSEMANDGRLPAYRIGIYLRFKWVEIETHLAATCKVRAGGSATDNQATSNTGNSAVAARHALPTMGGAQ